jgi:hypothetical protein
MGGLHGAGVDGQKQRCWRKWEAKRQGDGAAPPDFRAYVLQLVRCLEDRSGDDSGGGAVHLAWRVWQSSHCDTTMPALPRYSGGVTWPSIELGGRRGDPVRPWIAERAGSFCSYRRSPPGVVEAIGYGGEVVAGIMRQGTSSSMRLIVWPSAILARTSRR